MTQQMELATQLSPAEFLAALERFAADWHESRLPAAMRDRGVAGLAFDRLGPAGFRLRLRGAQFRFGASHGGACTGNLVAKRGGGSVIHYTVGFSPHVRYAAIGAPVAAAAVVAAVAGPRWEALAVGGWLLAAGLALDAIQLPRTRAVLGPEFADILARVGAAPASKVAAT
jgi:hypothetical protein